MHGMRRRIILCHNRLNHSDSRLSNWEILLCLSNGVLKLPCWDISGHIQCFGMYDMHHGIVLCHNRLDCSDRRLLNWEILIFISFSMYKLSCWDL